MGRAPRAKARPKKTLRTAEANRKRRQGRLSDLRVSQITRARYATALNLFFRFWGARDFPTTWDSLDQACGAFVECLWAEGDPLGTAQDCLSGLKFHLPAVHGHLRFSRSLCKAWAKAEPPARAEPMSPVVALGLAGLCVTSGMMDVAALLLIGFDAFLRTGELFNIRKQDVVLYDTKAMIRLKSSKTGLRQGHTEMVIVESPVALRWLRRVVREIQEPHHLLTPRSPSSLRALLKDMLQRFQLGHLRMSWYSLRRGGASWDFLSHGSLEKTLLRGRWQSVRAARVYVQDATSAVVNLSLQPEVRKVLRLAARSL